MGGPYGIDWDDSEDGTTVDGPNGSLWCCTDQQSANELVDLLNGLVARAEKAERERDEARAKLRELEGEVSHIVNESDGVCGWHHNGEVAKWSEFGGMIADLAAAAPEGGEAP